MWGIRTITPKENCPRSMLVLVLGLVLGLGGNQTIPLEENCLLVRVRVWVRVSFGVISLGDNCPRTVIWTVPITSLTGYNIIRYTWDERKLFFPFRFESCVSGGHSSQLGMFHFLLIRTEWSWLFYHFHFFEYFSKDL